MNIAKISESEFEKICRGISADREIIFKHNPIGSEEETLLWMLMSIMISYLSLDENQTPCFTGVPTADTYRHAILFALRERKIKEFDPEFYLDRLVSNGF